MHAAQRAHLGTLTGLKQVHPQAVFKAMETVADRAVCVTRKILLLFDKSLCSVVFNPVLLAIFNTNLRN